MFGHLSRLSNLYVQNNGLLTHIFWFKTCSIFHFNKKKIVRRMPVSELLAFV